jgi:hypothetical protein
VRVNSEREGKHASHMWTALLKASLDSSDSGPKRRMNWGGKPPEEVIRELRVPEVKAVLMKLWEVSIWFFSWRNPHKSCMMFLL